MNEVKSIPVEITFVGGGKPANQSFQEWEDVEAD